MAADIAELSDLVSSLGARPVVMSAERHDRAVAVISHLPQLLAAALIESLEGEPEAMDLASGSFRDLTRVALSEPGWSSEVLLENRTEVERALGELVTSLGGWSLDLSGEEPEAVLQRLERARDGRRRLAPPVVLVEVLLRDEPGELAAVGRALATSRVDVRDLQLRHTPRMAAVVCWPSRCDPVRPEHCAELCSTRASRWWTSPHRKAVGQLEELDDVSVGIG